MVPGVWVFPVFNSRKDPFADYDVGMHLGLGLEVMKVV